MMMVVIMVVAVMILTMPYDHNDHGDVDGQAVRQAGRRALSCRSCPALTHGQPSMASSSSAGALGPVNEPEVGASSQDVGDSPPQSMSDSVCELFKADSRWLAAPCRLECVAPSDERQPKRARTCHGGPRTAGWGLGIHQLGGRIGLLGRARQLGGVFGMVRLLGHDNVVDCQRALAQR